MVVGEKLKAIRESKSMSQGDIERETGLLRCYISRVENGHTVPALRRNCWRVQGSGGVLSFSCNPAMMEPQLPK
jgi:hypothetical protein